MQKIQVTELSEDPQEEEISRYQKPTADQRERAWERLRELQNDVQRSFDEQGLTEDDLDRLLQEGE